MKIHEALKAFQSEGIKIKKTSVNPHFKSKYADLPTIMEAISPALIKHGIVITHRSDGKDLITTIQTEEDAICSHFPLFGSKPQEFGSSITYAKRYNIGALLNLDIDEDDDGNSANDAKRVHKEEEKPWFNYPNLEAFRKVAANYADANEALNAIRERYAINKEMQKIVREMYD